MHPQEKLQKQIEELKATSLASFIHKKESVEAAHHEMWLLLCFFRLAPAGCDRDVIRNHFMKRNSLNVKVQRWHDAVRHQLAIIEAQERMPASRTSRAAGWIQATEQMREKHMPALPSSMTVSTGQIVALHWSSRIEVAMILSVWRCYKKGCGSQLVYRTISRGAVHSCRVVVLRQVQESHENVFQCDSTSPCFVVPPHAIGVRLDTDNMKSKAAVNGRKIQLEDVTKHWEWMFF